MDLLIKEKIALVTASSAGIGQAIAAELANEGTIVYINGRNNDEIASTITAVKAKLPHAILRPMIADISTSHGAEKIFAEITNLDILVNNLGVYDDQPFFEASDEQWQRSFNINVMAAVRLSRNYLKNMLARKQGRVIFIASEAAVTPALELPYYSATKAMLLSVSRTLAELTRGTRVTVNSIIPGSTITNGSQNFVQSLYPSLSFEEAERQFMRENRKDSIIGRLIEPAEIAALVAFVCSARASAINGAAIRVDGGLIRTIF